MSAITPHQRHKKPATDGLSTPPARFPWPPVLFLSATALAAFTGIFYPLPWIGSPISDILFALGCLGIISAIAIYVSVFRLFKKENTSISPMNVANNLVTTGPFSVSRNPIYLSNVIVLFSIGFILGNIWFLLFAVLAAIATTKLSIEPEEKHLELRFGKRFRDYQKRVRRWI